MNQIVASIVAGLLSLVSLAPAGASWDGHIRPGDKLSGPQHNYALEHQYDGNIVLYDANHSPVWATGTQGTDSSRLSMQDDGNLVLYNNANQPIWQSGTHGNPGATLAVQGDGNLVIYKSDGNVAWAIKHWPPKPPTAPYGVWDDIAECESNGNWSINTGNGYYGGLQMDMTFWKSYGGKAFAAYPHQTSRTTQITVAERARDGWNGHRARGYTPWPNCGAPYR